MVGSHPNASASRFRAVVADSIPAAHSAAVNIQERIGFVDYSTGDKDVAKSRDFDEPIGQVSPDTQFALRIVEAHLFMLEFGALLRVRPLST